MQKLLAAGLIIIMAGIGLILVSATGQGNASAGGVVFIGPFPIVFGSGPEGWPLALLSLAVGAVMVVLILLWGLGFSKARME